MTAQDDTDRRTAWTAYWATGGLHSCVGSFPGNYSGAIGAFWQAIFASLAPGQRLLDLATGNGALPLLIWQQRGSDPGLHVEAVDLAQLAPPWYQPDTHPGIRFHSGVAMEKLPFADGHFDVVTSQFGFEYARRQPALREALRVLAPGGRLALVMHHAGSVLVDVGRAELAHQQHLLAADGLVAAAEGVLPWFARARSGESLVGQAEALQRRETYNAAIRRLGAQASASRVPDLLIEARDWIHSLIAGVGVDAGPALRALGDYRSALQAAGLRTEEMISHALDESQVRSMLATLAESRPQARISCEPLQQREGVLGWALRLEPPG